LEEKKGASAQVKFAIVFCQTPEIPEVFEKFPSVHRLVGKMGKDFCKKRGELVSFLRFNSTAARAYPQLLWSVFVHKTRLKQGEFCVFRSRPTLNTL